MSHHSIQNYLLFLFGNITCLWAGRFWREVQHPWLSDFQAEMSPIALEPNKSVGPSELILPVNGVRCCTSRQNLGLRWGSDMHIAAISNPFTEIDKNADSKVIVLIERSTLIRDCLARCISDEFGCDVAVFPDVQSWQKASSNLRASLIVVSIVGGSNTLADEHTDEVIRQLSLSQAGAPIIVLSDAEDIDFVADSLRHGVRGHIPTATTLNVAIKAMQLVLVGGVYVPASNFLTARHSVAKVGAGDKTIVSPRRGLRANISAKASSE